MSNTGAISGGTFATVAAALGSGTWVNPSNAGAADAVFATLTGGGRSNYLQATNFGFSIPSGATIDGIVLEVKWKDTALGNTFQYSVKLVKGGTVSGTDKSTGGVLSATNSYSTFGTSTDLWGLTLTDTDINASTFGGVVAVQNGGKGTYNCSIDHIRITVYYTSGGAPSNTTNFFQFF